MNAIDPDHRFAEEPSPADLVGWYVARGLWDSAAQHVSAGMELVLSNEEALFLASHLPDLLRLDRGEPGRWHVSTEGFCSW